MNPGSVYSIVTLTFTPYCVPTKQTSKKEKKMYMRINPTRNWGNSSQRWPIRLYFKVNKIPWHISPKKKDWKRGDWRCRHLSYFFAFLYFVDALNCEKYIALYPFWVFLLSRISLDGALTTTNTSSIYNIGRRGERGWTKTKIWKKSPSHPQKRIFGWKGIRTEERKRKKKKRFR